MSLAPVLPPHASLTRSGSLSYEVHNERLGSSHTRAKLPVTSRSSEGKAEESPTQVSAPPRLPPRPETLRTTSMGTYASSTSDHVSASTSATTNAMESSTAASFATVNPSESVSAVENLHEHGEDNPKAKGSSENTDAQPLAPKIVDLSAQEQTK